LLSGLSYQSDLMREPWGFLDIAAEVHRRLVVLPVATFAEAVEIEVAEISFIEGIVVSRDRKGGFMSICRPFIATGGGCRHSACLTSLSNLWADWCLKPIRKL
jgi:hypothetical protein